MTETIETIIHKLRDNRAALLATAVSPANVQSLLDHRRIEKALLGKLKAHIFSDLIK